MKRCIEDVDVSCELLLCMVDLFKFQEYCKLKGTSTVPCILSNLGR